MALSIRVLRLVLEDPDGVGPVRGVVEAEVVENNAANTAVGLGRNRDSRIVSLPRPAWNALLSALRRPNNDAWPDGTLAHPVAKDP